MFKMLGAASRCKSDAGVPSISNSSPTACSMMSVNVRLPPIASITLLCCPSVVDRRPVTVPKPRRNPPEVLSPKFNPPVGASSTPPDILIVPLVTSCLALISNVAKRPISSV